MPKESGNLDEHVTMGIIVKVRRRVCGINRSSVEDYTEPVQGKQGSDIGGTRSSIITACHRPDRSIYRHMLCQFMSPENGLGALHSAGEAFKFVVSCKIKMSL